MASQFCSPTPIHHPSNPNHRARIYPCFQILAITSSTPAAKQSQHPAKGQFGLFASRDIPPKTFILPYLGVVHLEEESDENSEYDLRVWGEGENLERIPLGIDATVAGSEARFCNDYRGILQRANVFFEEWTVASSDISCSTKGLALVSGAHVIKKGTELCVSYGKGFWEARHKDARKQVPREQRQDEDHHATTSFDSRLQPVVTGEGSQRMSLASAEPQLNVIKASLERQRARLAVRR